MSDPMISFVKPLMAHYDLRKPDVDQFLADLTGRLKGYSDEVLIKARQHLIDAHPRTTFPTVPECHEACRQFLPKTDHVAEPRGRKRSDPLRFNDRLKTSQHAAAAFEGNWINGLNDFYHAHDREPSDLEIGRMMAQADDIARNLGGADEMSRKLADMWFGRIDALAKFAGVYSRRGE